MQTGLHIFILPRDPHLVSVWLHDRYCSIKASLELRQENIFNTHLQLAHICFPGGSLTVFPGPREALYVLLRLCPGDFTGKLKLHLSTSSCLYLDQVYLYLWVGCGPFLSQLYARYCSNNLFKSQNKKSIRVNKITSTFLCLITKP